jgi:membrane protease YdiL (CAAX protease family)
VSVLWSIVKKLFVALSAVIGPVLLFRFVVVPAIALIIEPGTLAETLVRRSGTLHAAVLGYWTYVRFREKRRVSELKVMPLGILVGTASGAALISITTLSLFLLGAYQMIAWRGAQSGLLGVAGVILIAAVLEEIVFRGVLFRILEEPWGTVPALWLSSLIFALLHLGNFEDGTSIVVLVTTVAAATLISAYWTLVFVHSRNSSSTHHAAWNFAIILSGAPLPDSRNGAAWRRSKAGMTAGMAHWRCSVRGLDHHFHGNGNLPRSTVSFRQDDRPSLSPRPAVPAPSAGPAGCDAPCSVAAGNRRIPHGALVAARHRRSRRILRKGGESAGHVRLAQP